jgi:recombinational DNA repair protein (RecF pathway)
MANWSTLHIFGFGDVQVIAKEGGKTKKASDLTKLQAVIDMVWAQKPDDNTSTNEYHAINIFNGLFADWQSKTKVDKGYRTKYDKLIAETIEALIDEVLA